MKPPTKLSCRDNLVTYFLSKLMINKRPHCLCQFLWKLKETCIIVKSIITTKVNILCRRFQYYNKQRIMAFRGMSVTNEYQALKLSQDTYFNALVCLCDRFPWQIVKTFGFNDHMFGKLLPLIITSTFFQCVWSVVHAFRGIWQVIVVQGSKSRKISAWL